MQGGPGYRPLVPPQARGPRTNPRGRGGQPQTRARVFAITTEEDPNAVISSTLLIENVYVSALVDPGATHSFVTPEIASKLPYVPIEMEYEL